MKRIAALITVAITVNMYWFDGDGDKTKTVLIMEYSDGTVDKLVVDKKDLKSSEKKIVEEANKLLEKKGLTYGY